jgi:hypothetical protein
MVRARCSAAARHVGRAPGLHDGCILVSQVVPRLWIWSTKRRSSLGWQPLPRAGTRKVIRPRFVDQFEAVRSSIVEISRSCDVGLLV